MIGISESVKQELEVSIAELESIFSESDNDLYILGKIKVLKMILSRAIVVPVEQSWESFDNKSIDYSNGVLIDDNKN